MTYFWYKNQPSEFDHFLKLIQEKKILFDADSMRLIHQAHTYQEKEVILDKINCAIIKSRIDLNSKELNLINQYLTRFPIQLFEDKKYTQYWKSLERLHCGGNFLGALPNSLGMCESLFVINCSGNQIEFLPESLYHIPLKMLCCGHNRLKYLPRTICMCEQLEDVDFSYNAIAVLPESLGDCRKLRYLNLNNNKLRELPKSLKECEKLVDLFLENNLVSFQPTLSASQGYYPSQNISAQKNPILIQQVNAETQKDRPFKRR